MTIAVHRNPCSSCPYRKDSPSGLWHPEEYEKLRAYDNEDVSLENGNLATFHCHQEKISGQDTVCKGWLMVHQNTVAVRLCQYRHGIGIDQFEVDKGIELHESGNAAADHGERDIAKPKRKALDMAAKLTKTGAFLEGD